MERQKVDTQDLRVGMYVAELDRPWLETPFLFQGFPIRTAEDIAALQLHCRYVYIDVEQSQLLPAQPHSHYSFQPPNPLPSGGSGVRDVAGAGKGPQRPLISFDAEIKGAVQIYRNSRQYINTVFEDARLGRSIDPEGARLLADQVVESVIRNESAMVWLTQLKHRDEYTAQHSINVCVLSVLFGRHLGLEQHELHELGFGALLHDIGKMRIPLEVLNKRERLSDEEMSLLRQHPAMGYEILKGSKGGASLSPLVLEIAHAHHERIDGSGYPRGLAGDAIHRFVKIVSIVDAYDAITSDRAYHMGIAPHEALNMMYGWAPRSFNSEMLEEFIRCLGIYPIGSIVELDTGEVGVVMTVNRQRVMRPLLTMVLDREKRPLAMRKLLNLELLERSGVEVGIQKLLAANAYGINVRQIIMESQAGSAVH